MNLLTKEQSSKLIETLKLRFEKNIHRHNDIEWNNVLEKLIKNKEKLWSINEMEKTGGEPDVIGYNKKTDEYLICDCSKETPKGRRGVCYDIEALESRNKFKPEKSAKEMANEMGIKILNEEEYKNLQNIESFDLKTSSWIETGYEVRRLGGALFGDNRYNRTFIYHNGAESYYKARGFRGYVKI